MAAHSECNGRAVTFDEEVGFWRYDDNGEQVVWESVSLRDLWNDFVSKDGRSEQTSDRLVQDFLKKYGYAVMSVPVETIDPA